MPAYLTITAERRFASTLRLTWSASLCGCEQHDLVRWEWRWDGWQPFSGGFGHGRVIGLCDWPRPLATIFFTQHQTQKDLPWLKQGVILDTAHRRKFVTTDSFNKGWGALCEGKLTFGRWSEEESELHINCLEMLAVCQACQFLCDIYHQGSFVSKCLCKVANDLLVWAQTNLYSLKATHVPGKMNRGADMLSRNNVSSEEWTLHLLSVQKIGEVFGRARVELFASEDNSHCPIFFTKSTDALVDEWPSLPLYAFPPIA